MRHILFFTIVVSLLLSCESNVVSAPDVADENNISPTHMATFEIEGMMCQKGCGSAIRKGLYDTGGVSEVEVAFDEANPVNIIKVFFDSNKTSTDKMITVIGGLADNLYSAKLTKVSQTTISSKRVVAEVESSDQSLASIPTREVSTKSFSFPNLTKLLNGLIN